MTKDKTTFFSL